MATPVVKVADLNSFLKEVNIKAQSIDVLRLNDFLLTNLNQNTSAEIISGRVSRFNVKLTRNSSFRGQNEGELNAPIGVPTSIDPQVVVHMHSATTGWTIQAEGAMKGGDKASYLAGTAALMLDTVQGFREHWSALLWGDGSGAMARVNSVAGNVVTLYAEDSASANNTYADRFMFPGQQLSASANKTAGDLICEVAFDGKVVSKDPVAGTITVDNAGALVNGSYLYWGGQARPSKNRVTDGLLSAVGDGSGAQFYENIDRLDDVNDLWRGNTVSSFGGKDIEAGLLTLLTVMDSRIRNANTSVILTHPFTLHSYFNQLRIDRTAMVPISSMAGTPIVFNGGFDALAFHHSGRTIPIVDTVEAPRRKMWLLDWDALFIGYQFESDWLDMTGNGPLKEVEEEPAVRATYFNVSNLCATNPAAIGMIDGVNEYIVQ